MSVRIRLRPSRRKGRAVWALAAALCCAPSVQADDGRGQDKPAAGSGIGSEAASASFLLHGLQSPNRKDGLRVSGNATIDTGYERGGRGLENQADLLFWLQQGRVMVQVTPTHNAADGYFFKANAQLLAHVDEIQGEEAIDTDDAWLKLGVWDCWDLQVGRYEAWEVYHKGQGLERDTLEDLGAFDGPDIYEVNYAFYRQDGFGQAALHLYPSQALRFELSSVFGNELGFNSIGVRPAAILDLGRIKVKAAAEWRQVENMDQSKRERQSFWQEKRGFGGSVQAFFDEPGRAVPIQLGVNGAFGLVDKLTFDGRVDEEASVDTLSVGAFVNAGLDKLSLGLGANMTWQGDRKYNDKTDREGEFEHLQLFTSLKRSLIVPQATVKLVLAYARADLRPAFENPRVNEMYSVRLRLMYVF